MDKAVNEKPVEFKKYIHIVLVVSKGIGVVIVKITAALAHVVM